MNLEQQKKARLLQDKLNGIIEEINALTRSIEKEEDEFEKAFADYQNSKGSHVRHVDEYGNIHWIHAQIASHTVQTEPDTFTQFWKTADGKVADLLSMHEECWEGCDMSKLGAW